MLEVELTAVLNHPEQVFKKLQEYSIYSTHRYFDRYYDQENKLKERDQELRIRTKENLETGEQKNVFTLKDARFDEKSRSKPEYETIIEDPEQNANILEKLGFRQKIAYTKYCRFFSFRYSEKDIEISYVTFDEIPETFIEIETLANDHNETEEAFKVVYKILEELEIPESDLTTLTYQKRIKNARENL